MSDRLVALAVVVRPHGVRGDLRLKRYNPESDLLFEQRQVWLRQGETLRQGELDYVQPHGEDAALASIRGVRGREAAEALRGTEICVPREALPPPEEGEYYHVDLIGLTACDASGAEVGRVEKVLSYPTVDALRITCADGVREVPIVEPYVVDIDLDAARVVVAHLDDLPTERPRPKKR